MADRLLEENQHFSEGGGNCHWH